MIRAALIAAALAGPAQAHEWYDWECCGSTDCSAIPAPEWTPEGWRVRLMPGDHPMVSAPFEDVVPHDKARPSQDADWHVCIVPYRRDKVQCLYLPGSV